MQHDLKKPNSRYLPRRNEKRPFEDETSAEFLCEKNEASFFGFASHSKKRPNNLIRGRIFNYKVRLTAMPSHDAIASEPSVSLSPNRFFAHCNPTYLYIMLSIHHMVGQVYDMHELCLTNIKPMSQFKAAGNVPSYCNKPALIFQGDGFEHDSKVL